MTLDAAQIAACPFCGGDAEQDYSQHYRKMSDGALGKAVTIYCLSCSANMILCREDHPGVDPDDLMAELVETWNRRTALDAIAAREATERERDALREALEKIVSENKGYASDRITCFDCLDTTELARAALKETPK